MSEDNSDELVMGPVDIVVIGYPPDAPRTGEAIPLFLDLVDRGIIHVLDVKGVIREANGTFSGFDVGDVTAGGFPDLVAFEGAHTGLIGDDDLRAVVEAMEPGSAAVMIVFENTWAAPFATAVRRNGGQLLAYERVGAQDLLEAIEALDAADAAS
ncbi:MAG: DUF6325 family protein [Solirubrobacteraceae bacterium]